MYTLRKMISICNKEILNKLYKKRGNVLTLRMYHLNTLVMIIILILSINTLLIYRFKMLCQISIFGLA